jgi:hypothetical protein
MRATDATHCSLRQNRTFCLRSICAAETPKEKPPMKMSVGVLDHYNVSTRKLNETVRFYEDVLGFMNGPRPPFDFPGAWMYSAGHPVLHLNDISQTDKQRNGLQRCRRLRQAQSSHATWYRPIRHLRADRRLPPELAPDEPRDCWSSYSRSEKDCALAFPRRRVVVGKNI